MGKSVQHYFSHSLLLTTQEAFVDSVGQDQTAQNLIPDLPCSLFHSRL